MKLVYGIKTVLQDGKEKSFWKPIGIAYENKDGSLNIDLDYFPVKGQRLHVREKLESKETKAEETQNANFNDGETAGGPF